MIQQVNESIFNLEQNMRYLFFIDSKNFKIFKKKIQF